ncbi:TIGR02594 family protein [Bradyrhizobium rifense]|uniref:TIGR02594 family protein n=1 Tax=Bradyrhizobium rifense TaxID=515499 RepID=A0A5D3KKS2_9BRAD|nr:TIGR02594 family protein [Bradyrhizobium rifense]TYL91966.1 TIGR02594 family protein [Bradyrhizobium rifense]
MFELFASRLSRCVVALAIFFAAVAAFVSPASARPHHRHSAERPAYVHHARHHHYRHHASGSRFERSAAQLQARGFANTQASYDPNANSGGMANNGMAASGGFGGSGLVSEARRYIGGNPTGRGSLWCARFMNMVLQHTGHQGTGSDMASSFARYGTRVSGPQVGAIAVMGRRGGGHVGIITGIDAQGNPIMISGNNGNRVREAPISRGRIYAYVMPN